MGLHSHLGKPPALPEEMRSSIIPEVVRRERKHQAVFPLTLALSPRERGAVIQSGRMPQCARTISAPE
jgi:hypothetical protein